MELNCNKTNNVSQMNYAKKGIITKEMQFISERENCNLENFLKTLTKEQLKINNKHTGDFNYEIPKEYTPEFVRDEVARVVQLYL